MTAIQVEISDLKTVLREREMQVQDLHKEVEAAQKEAELAKREKAEAEAMAEANRTEMLALQGELATMDANKVADSFGAGMKLSDLSSVKLEASADGAAGAALAASTGSSDN